MIVVIVVPSGVTICRRRLLFFIPFTIGSRIARNPRRNGIPLVGSPTRLLEGVNFEATARTVIPRWSQCSGSVLIVAINPARLSSTSPRNLSKNTTRFMQTPPQSTPHSYWLRPNGTLATSRASPLNGKTPQELVIMAETRRLLQLILHNKREEASPDLISTIEALLRSRLRRTSPLTELGPIQRIAWLDEYTHIQCAKPLGDGFAIGEAYRVACLDIPVSTILDRQTMQGGSEEVLITGRELVVTIRDARKRIHGFSHTSIPSDVEIHELHHTQTLIDHFAIPEAPDITRVYPSTYRKLHTALSAL